MTTWIILMVIAYLLGSVPASFLVGRSRGIDLRHQGSRQVGGGNLWRTTSRRLGLTVGVFDFFKGMLMVLIAGKLGLDAAQQLAVGLAAIVGHNWPVFLRFHGGRGIATLLGIAIILPFINDISPWPTALAVGIVVALTVILRSSPLPVLFGVVSLPVTSWLFGGELTFVMTYVATFLVVVIKRLTAQPAIDTLEIGMGRLLLNRLLYDRDIGDRKAWVHRKHLPKKARMG